ncbi:MAG: TolC family protein [Alphaproteobacteria bacterium]
MLHYAACALCLLCLPACTVIPVTERADIARKMPSEFAAAGPVVYDDELAWQSSFADPRLVADVQALTTQNFELESARARLEQAAADYGIRRAELFPVVDATANAQRIREKEPTGSTEITSTIDFGAALVWDLDIWGQLLAKKEAASLTLEEQKALVDQTALDVQTLLVESWVAHHAAQKLGAVIRDQSDTNARFLELTELRFMQGQGNALDVLQQRGRLAATKRALPSVEADAVAAANAYDVLLGKPPAAAPKPLQKWPEIMPFSSLPSPPTLVETRPDIRAAFFALRAADQEVAAAIADRLPRLAVDLRYTLSGDALSTVGDGRSLGVTGGVLAPIFDAGRRKAQVSRREAEAKEALADLEQAMLVALREIENALSRERALFTEQRLLNEERAIAQSTVEKAKLRYVNGQENYLSVLSALENQQTLFQQSITLERDLLLNRARLLKAFGATWNQKDIRDETSNL